MNDELLVLNFFMILASVFYSYLEKWTHHTPMYTLLILVGIASILVPVHHRMERFIKERLAHKIHPVGHPAMQMTQTNTLRNKPDVKNQYIILSSPPAFYPWRAMKVTKAPGNFIIFNN